MNDTKVKKTFEEINREFSEAMDEWNTEMVNLREEIRKLIDFFLNY